MTEKQYAPTKTEKKVLDKVVTPKIKEKIPAGSDNKKIDSAKPEERTEDKKTEEKPKKPVQKKPVIKKDKAIVNGSGVPISTKTSIEICRFITGKRVGDAIRELEEIASMKKALPMKGEIPHRKGKGMMSGRYPKRAIGYFISLLKNLAGNSIANNLDNPVILEAIANKASRPFGRFGRWQRKRTHIKIIAIENQKRKQLKSKRNKNKIKEKK